MPTLPPFLQSGDAVSIVTPAKHIQGDLKQGIAVLESWGLKVKLGEHVYERDAYFAGNDAMRKADLQKALDDPETKAVIMARGGYGTTRILDELDYESLLTQPKWICGFSDITALLIKLDNQGMATLHSTVPLLMGKEEYESSDESLRSALFGEELNYAFSGSSFNRQGEAEGQMIGGNLSIVCNSIGTSSDIDTDGKLLFLEDVGEYLYHIDRMMVHLDRAGKLRGLRGLVIGHFSFLKDHRDSFGMDFQEIISHHASKYDFPVCFDFPSGHEAPNQAIFFGRKVQLNVGPDEVQLSFK